MTETVKGSKMTTTKLIDQVIGQPKAVKAVKRAATAQRNLLLIGLPGTGKSMLGKSLSELLHTRKLFDIIAKLNSDDTSKPIIEMVPAGEGEKLLEEEALQLIKMEQQYGYITIYGLIVILATALTFVLFNNSIVLIDALFSMLLAITWIMYRKRSASSRLRQRSALIISNKRDQVPFIDASGSSYNILLGDVRHDPYQSGGLETPPHHLLVPGLVHKAHGGVLYIDEIGTLDAETQFHLLTALQDRTFPIEGRGENSSGSVVKTNPIPCDFTLVAAGNIETLELLHPALRSRILGFGMEVLMESHYKIKSKEEIITLLRQLIKQELTDHSLNFNETAINGLGQIAELIGKRDNYISLKLRELGGIIRSAYDQVLLRKNKHISYDDVISAYDQQIPIEVQLELQSQVSKNNETAMYWDTSYCWSQYNEADKTKYDLLQIASTVVHSLDKSILNRMNQFMQVIRERENKKKEIKLFITSKRGQIYNTGNKLPAAVVVMSIAEIYHLCLPKNVLVIGSVDYELNPDPMFSLAYNITHAKQSGFDYIFCLVQEDYRVYKNKEKDVSIVNTYDELVNLLKEKFGGE